MQGDTNSSNSIKIIYNDLSAENKLVLRDMLTSGGNKQVVKLLRDYYNLSERGAYYWVSKLKEEDVNELKKQESNSENKWVKRTRGSSSSRDNKRKVRREVGSKPIKELVNVTQKAPDGTVKEENTDTDTDISRMFVKGATTLVDGDKNVKLQWIKEASDEKLRMEAMAKAIEKHIENVTVPKLWEDDMLYWGNSKFSNSELMSKYPMADMHIGLRTYAKEVGEDWGLEQSKEVYTKGIKMVMDGTPDSEVGLILDLGDMFHVADSTNKTRGHGHALDVDGSLEDIYESAIFIATTMIEMALKKHKYVIFRKTIGNHDGDTSIALNVFLKRYYENNDRIKIAGNSDLFWWYRWGTTLHYSTHGHTVKQKDLPELVAHDCKAVWSDCEYIYADTGHIHHKQVAESRSMVCESHNTAIPGDKFNYGSSYRSGRLLKSITYSRIDGEVARNIVPIKKIKRELRS